MIITIQFVWLLQVQMNEKNTAVSMFVRSSLGVYILHYSSDLSFSYTYCLSLLHVKLSHFLASRLRSWPFSLFHTFRNRIGQTGWSVLVIVLVILYICIGTHELMHTITISRHLSMGPKLLCCLQATAFWCIFMGSVTMQCHISIWKMTKHV